MNKPLLSIVTTNKNDQYFENQLLRTKFIINYFVYSTKKMNAVKVKKNGNNIYITFKSKSFLQNQVRSMVGCLGYLATKKWSLLIYKEVFKSKNRQRCAPPAPAEGLYLKKIIY